MHKVSVQTMLLLNHHIQWA